MDEQEQLKRLQETAESNFKYFTNPNKPTRERYVVSHFLSNLGMEYREDEIRSLEEINKVDVEFRCASFQIKEITDPDIRRLGDYKKVKESLEKANSLKDVSLCSPVRNVPEVASMYDLVLNLAGDPAIQKKYAAEIEGLDLLVYVTRRRASLIQQHEFEKGGFSKLGWRSVSCVNTKQAVILFSSPSAPNFIGNRTGKIYWENDYSRGEGLR